VSHRRTRSPLVRRLVNNSGDVSLPSLIRSRASCILADLPSTAGYRSISAVIAAPSALTASSRVGNLECLGENPKRISAGEKPWLLMYCVFIKCTTSCRCRSQLMSCRESRATVIQSWLITICIILSINPTNQGAVTGAIICLIPFSFRYDVKSSLVK
jgi:hypothetical protein